MDGGLMVATSALGTGSRLPQDRLRTARGDAVEHDRLRAGERARRTSWRAGGFGHLGGAGRGGADDEAEERRLGRAGDGHVLDRQRCRRRLMSDYLDGRRVECNDVESAGCDRCGEGARGWQDAQREASAEWQQVREVLDEVREGCVVGWMIGDDVEKGEWQRHKVMHCTAHAGVTRHGAGRVSTGYPGRRRRSQLSTLLGQSEVLRDE
ncbi:hypothetical protein BU23DRAFT_133979 [Bimuria novae-zelandiae CBS 107.79]|uniref:Uncharacterized protein n=1 Tax=Bimuria novae-zelandiae CBS 107.79 TaxID=1447943 RepID=A0A6A5V8T5_9PLEO|nr:hypothetical protein BU23DRAFT_133979 [Bimuria novae-zelandiae CBS 107.79]